MTMTDETSLIVVADTRISQDDCFNDGIVNCVPHFLHVMAIFAEPTVQRRYSSNSVQKYS